MFANEQQLIAEQIARYCQENGLPQPANLQWQPLPFSGEWGISTNFFQLAALIAREIKANTGHGVNVPQKAQEIAAGVAAFLGKPAGFLRLEATRGYLNLYFSPAEFASRVVDAVLKRADDFGRGEPKGERVMVEYAQPNTHHSFHIGHYRNAILGEALSRLVEFAGFDTIRASYPGDLGLSVVTVLWAYDKFYRGQEPEGVYERGQWLLKIYVEAIELLTPKADEDEQAKAQREAYEAERREYYRRLDAGDPEVRHLWQVTRQWSLDELDAILEMLDIHIDVWFFESEVDEFAKKIVEELILLDIAEDERQKGGAVIVKIDEKLGLTKEKYRTNVILRSDGTTLYLTKDLALAKEKFEKYQVDRSIYVIDVRQSLHLQQAFKILELWGFPQAEKCYHLGYGFVSLPEGVMSARRGRVALFKDVADEAIRRVLAVIADKNPDMPSDQQQVVAQQIGLGALSFGMLCVDNNKDIVFDLEAALNFDGRTAPYIQNAYVRANSILKKAGGYPEQAVFDYELTEHETQLIDLISRFPAAVKTAAEEYKPLHMANYVYRLASAFHSFYHVVPVIQTKDAAVREARLRLVAAARQTIKNALRLLAIQAPDVM
ncbi:MAG TPA: arginine--tRNA ligase [Anaerolineales bacterium]|nr:arginine--tRNA ligase [Anaerolineales bacterium]